MGITGETIISCRPPVLIGSQNYHPAAQLACAFVHHDEVSEVLLWKYVLSALSQLATLASSRGLIQRELQLANVYIIGLLNADSLTYKIITTISLTS